MINIENLKFGYKKQTPLFADLSLQLTGGSVYGLLGRNGAGKSTLLQIMQGLIYPQEGEIEVLNYLPKEREAGFLADCFLLSEDIYLPNLTIKSFVDLYAVFYPKFDHRLFGKLLYEFELSIENRLLKLSLGQKKKAMLAFGLATMARILLLDEPTNGLDIPSKKQFRSILASALTDDRIIVLSTHQIRDLQSLLDHLIVLDQGKIVFQESLLTIMERLYFWVSYQEPQASDVLYYERVAGGYFCIQSLEDQESLEVDIEILFNAILSDPKSFRELFKFQTHAD